MNFSTKFVPISSFRNIVDGFSLRPSIELKPRLASVAFNSLSAAPIKFLEII